MVISGSLPRITSLVAHLDILWATRNPPPTREKPIVRPEPQPTHLVIAGIETE